MPLLEKFVNRTSATSINTQKKQKNDIKLRTYLLRKNTKTSETSKTLKKMSKRQSGLTEETENQNQNWFDIQGILLTDWRPLLKCRGGLLGPNTQISAHLVPSTWRRTHKPGDTLGLCCPASPLCQPPNQPKFSKDMKRKRLKLQNAMLVRGNLFFEICLH